MMNRSSRPDILDLHPPVAANALPRRVSDSSTDVSLSSSASTTSLTLASNPLVNANPPPAYIAPSAAARLVTIDHEDFFRSLQDDGVFGSGTAMLVSNSSLALVNQFLDFLLYSFLSNAKSTSISALRPAITEVLRLRLAKEAVAGADQELRSYLGGDDEDVESFNGVLPEDGEVWNLEKTWKKCRVQCMVYSSLGDLEEDDEAFYLDGGLEGAVGLDQYQCQSHTPGIVSPPVAIWLTSILEFIGEQTLLVAGHATISRYSAQRIMAASSDNHKFDVTFPDKPVVEELDTEKVALNPVLGRMWRQWRKKGRNSARGYFSMPSRDGVLQRLERQESLRRSSGNDEGRTNEHLAVNMEDDTEPRKLEARPKISSATYGDAGLTPIVEGQMPGLSEWSKRVSQYGDDNVYTPLRRPQSLIVLPTTHAPPFVIGNPIKRPRSLPDLKRGDFADPSAEVDIVDVEVDYMSIPLPTPGPDEANELAELAEPEKELIQTSQSWDKPEEASIGRSLVEQAEDSPFTSSHMQTPVDTESKVDTKMSPHTGEVPQIVGIATATRQVLVPSVARYSQYEYDLPEVNPPRPKTPPVLHGTSFFCDEEDSPPPKRRASRILKESIGSISSSVEVGECMKHASSPGTGSSRPDRKIGHLHLVSTSSTYSERGTSVRVFTPPATPDKSRRSSSFSRPIHTSGSTSSQTSILKTLVSYGKHESDAESRSSHNSERLTSLDDKERSFEELISSGGTIHCTITPDPIRNMEKKRNSLPQKTPTADLADFLRYTGPDGRPAMSSTRSIPGSPRLPNKLRPSLPAVRIGAGTASLSDYIKNSPSSPVYAASDPSATSTKAHKNDTTPTLSITLAAGANTGNSPTEIGGLPAVIRLTGSNSPITNYHASNRLLARDASGSTGNNDTTSALADFFRNTTPLAIGELASRRISRSVAPFCSAMDSELFVHRDIIEEEHQLSASSASIASAPQLSYSSSFTSSTALLPSGPKVTMDKYGNNGVIPLSSTFPPPPASYAPSTTSFGPSTTSFGPSTTSFGPSTTSFSSMSDITRKHVRPKDKYALAIDSLDDDDSDMEGISLILPRKREEESLADFLRNTPPPPPPPRSHPFVHQNTSGSKPAQKKNSSVSLISRFGRSSRKNSISLSAEKIPPIPTANNQLSKYVALQIPTSAPAVTNKAPAVTNRARAGSARSSKDDFSQYGLAGGAVYRGGGGGHSRSNTQARGARSARNDTDSLADFLMNTAPPPESRPAQVTKEEGRSLLKKINFSRKKMGVTGGF